MNINDITLLDLIDQKTLQSLQDAFSAATGMAALATDSTGPVTNGSGFTDFCMNLTRKSTVGCERCNKCDLQGGAEASRTGRPAVYYCHAGLCDFAAPIIVDGKHIGSLIGGQVLPEPPDEEKFRKIAVDIGVDPDEYIAALRKIKVVPKKQIDAAANLLYQIGNTLSDIGYHRLISAEREESENGKIAEIHNIYNEIDAKINEVTTSINALKNDFEGIQTSAASSGKAVESTDSIVKAIENASTQLTLIGFNASIEAKRAGTAGAGFNVIAQEVRSLADKNTKQAGEVEHTLRDIKRAMQEINAQLKNIDKEVDKNVEIIESLRILLEQTSSMIKELS